MKLITRDTDYAVRALCYIAGKKRKIVSVSELVKVLKIPRPFLRKILQILNKKKILKSYKGGNGGFSLVLSADKILLVDLIEVFQGPLKINECFLRKRICPNRDICTLRKKIDALERYVISKLETMAISSLLNKKKKNHL